MTKISKTLDYFSSFDGTRIYYETHGAGEPIIFVYGIACLMNHWHRQVEYFSQSYQTICFDLRGHNKSERPVHDENLTIAATTKDILALMDHLKIGKAHFCGHSFGVPILIETYAQAPEKFKSLVLINGFARNPIKNMFGIKSFERVYDFVTAFYKSDPDLMKAMWRAVVENPLSVPLSALAGGFNLKLTSLKDIQVYARGVANMDLGVFLLLFKELMNFEGEQILEKISVPTLIICGEDDKVTPYLFQTEMASKIADSELLQVHYGSHCTQLDFPEFTNLRIEKFYAERCIK